MEKQTDVCPSKSPLFVRLLVGVLTACFGLGFLFNIYVIINGFLRQSGHASTFGVVPIVVEENEGDEELEDYVQPGDLLFAFEKRAERYENGETVAFSNNGIILIGKIVSAEERNGLLSFEIQAAFEEEPYKDPATEENLLGEIAVQLPYIGYIVLFLASLLGKIVFVGLPLLAYLVLLLVSEWRDRCEEGCTQKAPAPCFFRGRKRGAQGAYPTAIPFGVFLMTTVISVTAIYCGTHGEHSKKGKKESTPLHTFKARPIRPRCIRPIRAIRPVAVQSHVAAHSCANRKQVISRSRRGGRLI